MGSLQDQLLKAGLVSAERVAELERPPRAKKPAVEKPTGKQAPVKRSAGDKRRVKASGAGKKEQPARPAGARGRSRSGGRKKTVAASGDEMTLDEAWRRRQMSEKDAAAARLRAKLADEKARHQRNLELEAIVAGQILNDAEAMEPRYFLYRERIRHVHVTAEQRAALSRDEIGILVLRGRHLLLPRDIIERCARIAPDLIPDLAAGTAATDDAAAGSPPAPAAPDGGDGVE